MRVIGDVYTHSRYGSRLVAGAMDRLRFTWG
jgi:hypothetical protein